MYSSDWCPAPPPRAPASRLAQKAGRTSVPQIWIGTRHIGGCDDLFALERAGKLDALLSA